MKLIAIDNGHGKYDTPGKRTPKFPDGKQIKEWEFNYPTAKKLGQLLEHNGFKTIYTSDTEKDTSLANRVAVANEAKADLLVSIHYNALRGVWREGVGGIETFHYPTSNTSKKIAAIVQKHLISKTELRNRGVKAGNLYVLRNTEMPAILCECGFMDIRAEAELMLDEDYQWKCAKAIAEGVCEYYGVKYKDLQADKNVSKDNDKLYRVQVGAFKDKKNAESLLNELKQVGFNGIITDDIQSNNNKDNSENGNDNNTNKPINNKKSKYYKIGNTHIIETTPDNIKIEVLGNTLHNSGQYGVNGTFFDTSTAPVNSPNSCVFIAMNDGKVVSNNAQFNGWNAPSRATLIYHTTKKLGFRQLQNINPIRNNTIWAIGGYMVKPYMDFKNEKIPGSINYKTAHTYIGYDKNGKIYLIAKPNHMIKDIVPLMNQLNITNAIVLDGGGSTQLNHPDGKYTSSRRINTAILLKEV